jgi:hypothetical protein
LSYNKISGFSTLTNKKNYHFDFIDNNSFLALNQALAFPSVYVDGERITDKPLAKANKQEGDSNQFTSEFTGCVDLDDRYNSVVQIFSPLSVISASPQGTYTLDEFENNFLLNFNYPVTQGEGLIRIYRNDIEIGNLNGAINVNGVPPFTGFSYTFTNGVYRWVIPAGKFISFFGTHSEIIINFVIQDADFNNSDFNNNDFFTE